MLVVVTHPSAHITPETTQLIIDILMEITKLVLHLGTECLELVSKLRYGRGRTRRWSIIPNIHRRCRVVNLLIIFILSYVLLTVIIMVSQSNTREREERSSTREPSLSPVQSVLVIWRMVKSSEVTNWLVVENWMPFL